MFKLIYGCTITKCVMPGNKVEALAAALRLRNPDYDPQEAAANDDEEEGYVIPPYIEFFDEETRSIPTGLTPYVIQWAKDNGMEEVELSGFPSTLPFPPQVDPGVIPGITLRQYQVDAVAKALQLQRGILEIATGGGKSEIAIGITLSLGKPRTLYVVPDQAAMYQTYKRFVKRGFVEDEDIGRLGDNLYEIDRPIVIAIINSLNSAIKREDDQVLSMMQEADLFFADECHHQGTAESWQVVALQCLAQYRFGLSGTPYKDDRSRFNPHYLHPYDSWLTGLIGDTLVYVSAKQLQEQGDLAPIEVISFPAGGDPIQQTFGRLSWQRRMQWQHNYKYGIIQNETRNKRIVTLACNLVDMGRRPIISVKSKPHGRRLQFLLAEQNVSAVCSYGSGVTIVPRVLADELKWDHKEISVYDREMTPKLRKERKRTRAQIAVLEEEIADKPTAQKKKRLATLKKKLNSGPKKVGTEQEFVEVDQSVDIEWLVEEGYVEVLIGNVIYDEAQDLPVLTDMINAAGGNKQQRYRQKVGRVLRLHNDKELARVWEPYDDCCATLLRHTTERLTTAAAQGFPVIAGNEFAEAMSTLRLKDLRIGEINVKTNEIEVTIDLTIPVGEKNSYSFVKPRVSLRAELESGDDLEVCMKKLSADAKALFVQEALRQATTMSEVLRKGFAQTAKEYLGYFQETSD